MLIGFYIEIIAKKKTVCVFFYTLYIIYTQSYKYLIPIFVCIII